MHKAEGTGGELEERKYFETGPVDEVDKSEQLAAAACSAVARNPGIVASAAVEQVVDIVTDDSLGWQQRVGRLMRGVFASSYASCTLLCRL